MRWRRTALIGVAMALQVFYNAPIGLGGLAWTPWKTWDDALSSHWYAVALVPGIAWDDARKAAVASGGYLADITTARENDFVYSLVDPDAHPELWFYEPEGPRIGPWLGGFQPPNSKEPDGNWQWVSGSPFKYTNWSPGEPGNRYRGGGTPEEALHFYNFNYTAKWNDHPASASLKRVSKNNL